MVNGNIEVYDSQISSGLLAALEAKLPEYRILHYYELKKRKLTKNFMNLEKHPEIRRLRSLRGAIQFLEKWHKNKKNYKSCQLYLTPYPLTDDSRVDYYMLNEKLYRENKPLASLKWTADKSSVPVFA